METTPRIELYATRFSEERLAFLSASQNIAGMLSIVGIAFFYCYTSRISNNSLSLRLIKHLVAADLIYGVSNVLSAFHYDTVCLIEGFLREYSIICILVWAASLGHLAYTQVIHKNYILRDRFWILLVLGYVMPIFLAIIPLIPESGQSYGVVSVYCCIVDRSTGGPLRLGMVFAMFLGEMWFTVILITYWYVRLYMYCLKAKQLGIKANKTLFLYPLITLIPCLSLTLQKLFSNDETAFYFEIIHILGQHMNGLFTVLVYGYQTLKYIDVEQKKELVASLEL